MKSHKYTFKDLKPKAINDLVRVGNKDYDGGYILSKKQIEITKVLIGLGVNYDWTFEEDFKARSGGCSVYCYDFSVGEKVYLKSLVSSLFNVISVNSYTKEIFNKRLPFSVLQKPFSVLNTYLKFKSFFKPANKNFFFELGVSDTSYDQFIPVKEVFAKIGPLESIPDNSVYMKMDIEQSEYDILEDVLTYSSKINGMAIEFHDLRHFWSDFTFLMDKIRGEYEIVHIHGNNCCGYIPNTELPNFIELSLIKRSLLGNDELTAKNDKTYPLKELDRPNVTGRADLKISFE